MVENEKPIDPPFNTAAKIMTILEHILISMTAVVMAILTVIVSYQVFARYVLHNSPFWVEEFSEVMMMFLGMIGAAAATWNESHMDLTFLTSKLPEVPRVWLRASVDILIMGVGIYIFYYSLPLIHQLMEEYFLVLPVPVGYSYLILPFSGLLIALFSLVKGINRVLKLYSKNKKREKKHG